MKAPVSTPKAPAAIGPYSQAVCVDNLVFCSGQIPLIPETAEMAQGGIEAQTRQVLHNISELLAAAGSDMGKVVKTTVFLQNMDDFAAMNAVYAEAFNGTVFPARSAVEVAKLPKGALVEIEVIAVK